MTLHIAPATPRDVATIRTLICELAEFEHLLDEATASEAQLHAALFGPTPSAEVVIARVDDEVAGFALFFHNFSTFLGRRGLYLEDLFVRPQFRGSGCGKALFMHLATIAVERGCGRFEWSVLDWNKRAIDFYQSLGALPMKEWTTYRVSGQALEQLARTK